MTIKRCDKCGARAVARMNGRYLLCSRCAEKAAIASLSMGAPVLEAVRGEPRYLIIPTGPGHSDN